ncbi:MAG TPA: TonB-dependent receptor [Thermoanaerobaculia bacterium]|nr:TonB-dependent receptor [Thermoanaerobaculia bacterium]
MSFKKSSAVRRAALAILLALVAVVALAPAASAQTAGSTLTGRIEDKDGGALPGVTVTARNNDTGLDRVAVTGSDGAFTLPSLPIGLYTVTAELSGFATVTIEEVRLNVATTRNIEIEMSSASVEEQITVVDEAPLIQTTPSIGTVVSQEELENLPLNGRQFANLAALAPGTTLAYNTDPTKPGQLTIALNGGIGRNVNFIMDGGDNTDDTIGGALQNFNLEAVAEFNVQTQQYKAEYGRSSGGVLTVVTKTGTNELAGSVYGFFRDDSLSSKTETEQRAGIEKQKLEREQYGASIGGPIVRDRAHFFATYEQTERQTEYTVFTDGAFPQFDGLTVPVPFEDELITAKVTYDVSPTQFLQVRYGFQENADKYGQSPLTHPTGLGTLSNEYESILAGHTAQLGASMLNEALFQYSSFDNIISADSGDPFIIYPSGFFTGQNVNTPQTTHQRKRQWKDEFSFSATLFGDYHGFKTGVNYIDGYDLGVTFTTGTAGQFVASENRFGSPITGIEIFGGFAGNNTPTDQKSFYFQDDWQVNDRLTVNLGVRYDYFTGFDLDQRSNPLYQALNTQTQFNEYYLADFRNFDGVLDEDDDNLAPRLGFTYDLKGDGRHLLRGGYGTYFDFPYTNATILFPAIAVQALYGVVYLHENPEGIRNPDGSLFQPGQPLPPNQLQNPELGAVVNEIASPTLATPYSDQTSLGYSWQVNGWLGLTLDLVSIDYHDIPYRFRANPGVDADGDGVFEPQDGETTRFPELGNFRMWYGGGRANYDGANLGFRVRQEKFDLQGFYTYSEAEGNVLAGADEFRLTDGGAQSDVGGGARADRTINPLDPQCGRCFGPLYTDARHRLTFGGTYRGPWGINVSGMFRYRSELPYLEHADADLNGDGVILDLRPGVARVNSGRGFDFSQFDVRLSKEFTFGDFGVELIGEVFNLLNEKNPARPDRFGEATVFAGDPGQGEQQLIQLGARFRF